MDADDKQKIDDDLRTTQGNLEMLTRNSNLQVKINNDFEQSINKIIDKVNEQSKVITKSIGNVYLDKITSDLTYLKIELKIKENLNYILRMLERCESIVLNSKSGYLIKNILNTQEIHKFVNAETLQNIQVSVAFHETELFVFIQIPNFANELYIKTAIIPIPNKNNLELSTNIKEVITCKNKIFEYTKDNKIKNLHKITDKCINTILTKNPENCRMRSNFEQIIQRITQDIVITKNLNDSKISHNCNSHEIHISGNNLIKFKNCKITISNISYSNVEVKETLLLPNIVKNISFTDITNLTLEHLNKLHIKNNEEIKLLKYGSKYNSYMSIITDGMIAIVVIILIIVIIIKYINKCKVNSQESVLKDGRVTVPSTATDSIF